jgi:hypothetical protein
MEAVSIFSDEFTHAAAMAGLRARQNALSTGHSVVFLDEFGRCVEELPARYIFNPSANRPRLVDEVPTLSVIAGPTRARSSSTRG